MGFVVMMGMSSPNLLPIRVSCVVPMDECICTATYC